MEQLMKKAIEGLDVDYAEIRLERTETTGMTYLGPVLEKMGKTFTLGGCVRVCVRGGWGFASFNTIEDARKSALAACELAALTAGERTNLSPVEKVVASLKDSVAVNPASVPLEDKRELLKSYNDILLADNEIVTTKAIYRDVKQNVWLHTSGGTMIDEEKIYTGMMLMAVAKDGANIQRGHKSFGDRRGYDTVMNREDDMNEVLKITRELMSAAKVTGGVYPVILSPQLAGVFVHEAFGHLSEADFVYENPKAREMMTLGRRFGPEILDIIDDGSLAGEYGFSPYDDEGVKKGRTHLIKNGELVGRLHSRETAGQMDEKPSGNARAIDFTFKPIVRMTSTFIDNGETSFDEMAAGIKDGIYACGFFGGNTDLERFTFSSSHAYKIENGKITKPLRDVILSGNVFETLNNITAVGNDLELFGGLGGCGKGGQVPLPVSLGSPHLCINNVLVG